MLKLPNKKFLLADERYPRLTLDVSVPRDVFSNSKQAQKRSFWQKVSEVLTFGLFARQDQVTLRIVEGASLTLMGVIRFDLASMQW